MMKNIPAVIVLTILILFFVLLKLDQPQIWGWDSGTIAAKAKWTPSLRQAAGGVVEGVGGSTGTLFSGAKIRTFALPLRLQDSTEGLISSSAVQAASFPNHGEVKCDRWSVVTTIFGVTEAVKVVARLEGWCLVIVGDMKTPADYVQDLGLPGGSDIVFLSAEDQKKIISPFLQRLPFNSFSRKNVGYLYAIRHGAKVVYDFDDANVLQLSEAAGGSSTLPPELSPLEAFVATASFKVRLTNCSREQSLAFNPFSRMSPSVEGTWPRGFPLSFVQNGTSSGGVCDDREQLANIPRDNVGVVQSTHDNDPDVDAVYRLTRKLPNTYRHDRSAHNLLVPRNAFAPYNAQATIHYNSAFWGLFLPFTVNGRVSDIWRSYFTAKIFRYLGLSVMYTPPLVTQDRNEHNYLANLAAEQDLYFKTDQLLLFLNSWTHERPYLSLPALLEQLWIALYERDYIGHEDVLAFQDWILTLLNIGYEFPVPQRAPVLTQAVPDKICSMEGQNYSCGPAFNVNKGGLTYGEAMSVPNKMTWDAWNVNRNQWRPGEKVLKIVLMHRNEFPLVQFWIRYHGKLFGFENLYIIDGSDDEDTITYLKHARDSLGVNIIFSTANLNGVETTINLMMTNLAGASDLLIKLDTDEFLGLCNSGSPGCTMDPARVNTYLNSDEFVLDGHKMKVGFVSGSVPNKTLCDAPGEFSYRDLHWQPATSTTFKSFFDSRTFKHVDLGSHGGQIWEPKLSGDIPTKLAIFHMHFLCLKNLIYNDKQACERHAYLNPKHSDAEQLKAVVQLLTKKGQIEKAEDLCEVGREMKNCFGNSCHKVWSRAIALQCPEMFEDTFYGATDGIFHPEWSAFVEALMTDKQKV